MRITILIDERKEKKKENYSSNSPEYTVNFLSWQIILSSPRGSYSTHTVWNLFTLIHQQVMINHCFLDYRWQSVYYGIFINFMTWHSIESTIL